MAILLLPGIIWARLDVRYAIKKRTSEFDFFIRAFVYGLASYAVTFALYALVRRPFALIDVTAADNRNIIARQVGGEIIVATAVGFCLAILWIYAANWKLLTRLLHAIRATRRYGDDDVWDFTFNSTATASRFVNIRDSDKKIVYTGGVNAFWRRTSCANSPCTMSRCTTLPGSFSTTFLISIPLGSPTTFTSDFP